MSSAKCGVNTMRICDSTRLLFIVLLGLLMAVWGCGGGSDTDTGSTDTTAAAPPDTSVEGIVSTMLNDAVERAGYGDVSGLWDNEFNYLHEQETYDFYVKRGQVTWAGSTADTVQRIEVLSVTPFDQDSALVGVVVHFKGPSGKETELDQDLVIYRQDGRWIKPTISAIALQVNYDSIRNEAIRAAEREAGQ